jgi:type IV pilus assembly protein PilX
MSFIVLDASSHKGSVKQSGFVLVVALLFLVMITILALAGAQTSLFGERIAGNERDRMIALQAAEAAMKDAERDLRNLDYTGKPCPKGGAGCVPVDQIGPDAYDSTCKKGRCLNLDVPAGSTWRTSSLAANAIELGSYTKGTNAKAASFEVNGSELANKPKYLIEWFPRAFETKRNAQGVGVIPPQVSDIYRIYAFGYGQNPNTIVVLESLFFPDNDPE